METVKARLLFKMLNKGCSLKEDSPMRLVFEKPSDGSFMTSMLAGEYMEYRTFYTFVIVQIQSSVNVAATAEKLRITEHGPSGSIKLKGIYLGEWLAELKTECSS